MVRRRRLCMSCNERFTTFESVVFDKTNASLALRSARLQSRLDRLSPIRLSVVMQLIDAFESDAPIAISDTDEPAAISPS